MSGTGSRRRTVALGIRDRLADESGAATVLAVAIAGACVALAAGFASVLAGVVASQYAANAADAASLAAADALSGAVAEAPCAMAARAAERNAARIVACEVAGPTVLVRVAVDAPFAPATADARAGPPDPTG
ncbi:Rv3654c family TadE-like protein [Agromyces arachidis]|uniref:Rv3654c family TadE-like protein n=1 Tax=Agromyces arachidis TaxID=766966 RepID=UPI004057B73C